MAQKVVTGNRLRIGLGREITVAELRVEELGGGEGVLVFSPVTVFNGQVCMKIKKKLFDVSVKVRFRGEVEGNEDGDGDGVDEFVWVEKALYRGGELGRWGMNEGGGC